MISPRFEDLLGKSLLVLTFGYALMGKSAGVAAMLALADRPETWALELINRVTSLLFVALVIALTIRRLPPRTSASGWEPRAAAIGGTFTLILLLWVPSGVPSVPILTFANLLMIFGLTGSLWSLHFLGRSFSVMASARELVTGGPYGLVRHPLYFFEGLVALGMILSHWNVWAIVIGALHFALQFRRMQHEERVLRSAFPDYEGYAARVPMILPRLFGKARPAAAE
jgi:protein-S-isoprenylcysteine O-methyltransferase Ste14